jgi:hypothetical protein
VVSKTLHGGSLQSQTTLPWSSHHPTARLTPIYLEFVDVGSLKLVLAENESYAPVLVNQVSWQLGHILEERTDVVFLWRALVTINMDQEAKLGLLLLPRWVLG